MSRKIDPARRENILLAARAVFKENGYANARMSEIARRAGVADGTVYLYFKSKLDLVTALCEDYLKRKVTALAPILANPDRSAAIANCIHTALVLAEEDRDILRLLDLRTSLGKRGERLQWDREWSKMLAEKFEEGQKKGEMWPYDSVVAAELVVGILEWVAKFCLVWTTHKIERYEDTAVAMIQHALLTDGSGHTQPSFDRTSRVPVNEGNRFRRDERPVHHRGPAGPDGDRGATLQTNPHTSRHFDHRAGARYNGASVEGRC